MNLPSNSGTCSNMQLCINLDLCNPRILYCTKILKLFMLVQCVWLFRLYCCSTNLKFQKCVIRYGSDNCVLLFFSNVAMSEIAL